MKRQSRYYPALQHLQLDGLIVSSTPNLVHLQGPLGQVVDLDPSTTELFGTLVTLDLIHVNLELFVQSDDLAGEEHKVGIASVNVSLELARAGSGQILLELQVGVEACFASMVILSQAAVRVAQRVVHVRVSFQTKRSGRVVAASGATAGLRGTNGSRELRFRRDTSRVRGGQS